MEEFGKHRNGTLIGEKKYYINKSQSKWVSVGFSLERKYIPVVKLGGYKNKQNVIFDEEQWISFLNNQKNLLSFVYSKSTGWQSLSGNGYEIQFVFIGESRIIKITQDGGNEIFLAGETINELINLVNLIKYSFDLLKSQEFLNYYNRVISMVSNKNGDLNKNVYENISPSTNPNSENDSCVLELLIFYSDCIIEDVETYVCNEFVNKSENKKKSVREKYHNLKLASPTAQSQLEQTYKPITEPLKQLISTTGEPIVLKEEPFSLKEEFLTPKKKKYETSTPSKQRIVRKTGKTLILPSEIPSFFDTSVASVSQFPSIQETTVLAETSPFPKGSTSESLNLSDILEQTKQSIKNYIDSPSYQVYLSDFHKLPRSYINGSVRDTEHKFDHNYGVVHDIDGENFFLGLTQKPVKIVGKNIVVEGRTYEGTVGLYELLFKKEPVGFKPKDLDNNMDILKITNAYLHQQQKNYEKLTKFEGDIETITKYHNDVIDLKNYFETEITKLKTYMNETSKIDSVQKSKEDNLKLKFENFSTKFYDRVTKEVKYFKNNHDSIDKNIKRLDRTSNLNALLRKKNTDDIAFIKEQLNTILTQIPKLTSIQSSSEEEVRNLKIKMTLK
ncbi:unnamed protein product [Ceutorhynchus assimilis]|uniref:DUF8207 domain-containing protein n=1 Tax=Ceutorhynchus assimilis TaxID=467358 RepID=A0A9N9MHX5_9CUCU|nr:unnamed protein product [Ceutorhynchus assimilis]